MTEEVQTPVKVFISYSWDSDDHKNKVLGLAQALRDNGILCIIDQFVMSPDNWDRWMLDQIEESQFVLIICSERYYRRYRGHEEVNKGLGVTWESTIIMGQLYKGQGKNGKFYPIFFSSPDQKIIPDGLRTSFYDLSSYDLLNLDGDETRLIKDGGYKDLYRLLTNQPGVVPIKLGPLQKLVPNTREQYDKKSPQNPPVESLDQQTPEILYRKKVEEYVNRVSLSEPYNEISKLNKINLVKIRQTIDLDTDKAKAIEDDVLKLRHKLHEEYKQNLQEYQNLLTENLEEDAFLSDDIKFDLQELQRNLKLSDKDAEKLLLYAQLESSLKKEMWRAADETTKNLLLNVTNIQRDYFNDTDFKKIPCRDIHRIDKLWADHSNGHFGCSVQINIWKTTQESEGNLYDFFVQLGWGFYQKDGSFIYQNINNFGFDLNTPKGQLPVSLVYWGGTSEGRQAYIDRILLCLKNSIS